MSKDVIIDRYARLYEIPSQLARFGHNVFCLCLSYQGHPDGSWEHDGGEGDLRWHSTSFRGKALPAILSYPWKVLQQLEAFKPDILIAASDIPHVVLGSWLAKRLGVPFVADLYDNFEGFGQGRIPGFSHALRAAVRRAHLVTTTSAPLQNFIVDKYRTHGLVIAMPSAVDRSIFYQRSKEACRKNLQLPLHARLIGTAGGLYREKGIDQLYDAWPLLEKRYLDLHLVLAGPVEVGVPIPRGDRVHYLGLLPHERVAQLFCALDVGVMCVPDTVFGHYCFPQKAYEMLACRLPVVAADIGAMKELLSDFSQFLYRIGDAGDFCEKISLQLEVRKVPDLEILDWKNLVSEMERHMTAILEVDN